jgi:hypothetical protein
MNMTCRQTWLTLTEIGLVLNKQSTTKQISVTAMPHAVLQNRLQILVLSTCRSDFISYSN